MYPEENKIERELIQYVFGLTGGELADKPLRYAEIVHDPGIPSMVAKGYADYAPKNKIRRRWARYFYDGVPDYDGRYRDGAEYVTIVTCLLFGDMPRKIHMHGQVWRKVATYTHSGECECPGKDEGGGRVTKDHIGADQTGTSECVLCGEKLGEQHGFIYLGDGWAEVIYRRNG